MAEFGMSMLIQ